MSTHTRFAAVLFTAAAAFCAPSAARAGLMTSTQSATLPMTSTNFNTDGSGLSPLVFQKFDTQNNTLQLDEVVLTFHAQVQNNFGMTFTTPATITVSVGTGNPSVPGPVITLFEPNGTTQLLTAAASNNDAALSRTVTWGYNPGETLSQSFGTDQAVGSKFYLAPLITQASNSLTLTNPADLALFTGQGVLKLPVAAQAFSVFTSSSGNGSGWITTYGSADATVTYKYHNRTPVPEVVPEPTALILWGIGGVSVLVAHRVRRRAVVA